MVSLLGNDCRSKAFQFGVRVLEENLALGEIRIRLGLARMEGGGGDRASRDGVSSEWEQHCLTMSFPFLHGSPGNPQMFAT